MSLPLEEVMENIYDAEENCSISSDWNSGWRVKIGGAGHTGAIEQKDVGSLREAAEWLHERALIHFPDYARRLGITITRGAARSTHSRAPDDWLPGSSGSTVSGQEAACWAHVRRKFYDFHIAQASPVAAEALDRIGRLYAIETEIRSRPAKERAAARQARAGPELEALHAWMHATLTALSQKSELAAAIRYALSRWASLVRYRVTVGSRSITTPPGGHCVPWLWGGRTGCLQAPRAAASVLLTSTVC
jgi:hypothetical protein